MSFKIPEPLKLEHDELHAELARATKVSGKIGEAAREVAKIMHPHFLSEEEFALPPLGMLSDLAAGKVAPEMMAVLKMTDRLKAELPKMLEEHKAIVAALNRLSAVAREEHQEEYAHFAQKLILHARTEEEVMYPAAILIGDYIKRRLTKL